MEIQPAGRLFQGAESFHRIGISSKNWRVASALADQLTTLPCSMQIGAILMMVARYPIEDVTRFSRRHFFDDAFAQGHAVELAPEPPSASSGESGQAAGETVRRVWRS